MYSTSIFGLTPMGFKNFNGRKGRSNKNLPSTRHPPWMERLCCGPMGHGLRSRSFRRFDGIFLASGGVVEIGVLFPALGGSLWRIPDPTNGLFVCSAWTSWVFAICPKGLVFQSYLLRWTVFDRYVFLGSSHTSKNKVFGSVGKNWRNGHVCFPTRLVRQIKILFSTCFSGHSSQRCLVVSGRFLAKERVYYQVSRNLRYKIVCKTRFI